MTIDSDAGLAGFGIHAGYGGRPVLQGVDVQLGRGNWVAVIGPNGAGKTTLLKALGGVLQPTAGRIMLDGVPLRAYSRSALARKVAIVPQRLEVGFGLTVYDVVALGRSPYLGFLGALRQADVQAVRHALDETDLAALAGQPFAAVSGGEQQRAVLAMALAQETPYLLLDEPTVHLDLGQQARLMACLTTLRAERSIGVLAIMHDLNLAAAYFDRLVLLHDGRVLTAGGPDTVLTSDRIRRAFDAPVSVSGRNGAVQVTLDPERAPTVRTNS